MRRRSARLLVCAMEEPIPKQPQSDWRVPPPSTPAAAFVPSEQKVIQATPQQILSLVPPIASPNPGQAVLHPDPIATPPHAPFQQPIAIDVPIAPVRRRMPVTPLIATAPGVPIQHALSVAPLIPGPQAQHGYPTTAGMPQPMSFPFQSAQPFAMPQPYAPGYPQQPPAYGFAPMVAPIQTFVAIVTLYPMPQQQTFSQYAPNQYPPQQLASFQPLPGYPPPPPQQMSPYGQPQMQQQPAWPMPPQQQWAQPASPQQAPNY